MESLIANYRAYNGQSKPYQDIGGQEVKGHRNTKKRLKLLNFPKDLSGKTVLDLGCNMGAFCLEMIERNAHRVVGLDLSHSSINICQGIKEVKLKQDKRYKHLEYYVVNVNLGLNPLIHISRYQKFDYLLALSVWKHIYDSVFWQLIKSFVRIGVYLEMNATFDSRHLSQGQRNFLNQNRKNPKVLKKYFLEKSGAKEVKFLGYAKDLGGKRGNYLILFRPELHQDYKN